MNFFSKHYSSIQHTLNHRIVHQKMLINLTVVLQRILLERKQEHLSQSPHCKAAPLIKFAPDIIFFSKWEKSKWKQHLPISNSSWFPNNFRNVFCKRCYWMMTRNPFSKITSNRNISSLSLQEGSWISGIQATFTWWNNVWFC